MRLSQVKLLCWDSMLIKNMQSRSLAPSSLKGFPHVALPPARRRQQRAGDQRAPVTASSSSGAGPAAAKQVLPRGPGETVSNAAAACQRALEAGVKRQRVEMLLPLVGATDLDDWWVPSLRLRSQGCSAHALSHHGRPPQTGV